MPRTALFPYDTALMVLSFLWPLTLPFWVQQDPFFWDTVQLASKHAHFFYENGLRWTVLPGAMDSGHPPLLGYYLACCWMVFGKTLQVSHWAMLPFLLTCHYYLLQTAKKWLRPDIYMWVIPVFWLDPVMAGQSVMISPDIVLICFMLMALYGTIAEKKVLILLGTIGLCLVSMRGMMCAGALFAWQIGQYKRYKPVLLYFMPGLLLGFAFLVWHWWATGWIGHHAGSPWATAFQRTDTRGIVRNCLVLAWRFVDFGRIIEWLIWIIVALQIRRIWPVPKEMNVLFFLALFLLPTTLLYQNLSAHRYLLPLFVVLHFVVLRLCEQSTYAKAFAAGGVLFLFLGNFWVYPHGISMGWDSTLAHQPYHELHRRGVHFLQEKNIDFQKVGTCFPNINTLENLSLNGDTSTFAALDLQKNHFVFVSNIYNDFEKDDLKQLEEKWRLLYFQQHPNGVWLKIFQNPVLN
jgi:hypothetical protein